MASTKNFWRWMDGYCTFPPANKGPNDEVIQKHTFFPEIEQNAIIIKVKFLISLGIKKANDRARTFKEMFESGGTSDKSLWDHKQKLVVDKLKDKNPPVPLQTLENNMSHYKEMIEFYQNMPR